MKLSHAKSRLLTLLSLVLIFLRSTLALQPQQPIVSLHQSPDIAQYTNNDLLYSRDTIIDLDTNHQNFYDQLIITEAVYDLPIKGALILAPGDSTQLHDFQILIRVSAHTENALDLITTTVTDNINNVTITSTTCPNPPPPPAPASPEQQQPQPNPAHPPLHLSIILFIRPHTMQTSGAKTQINTRNLPIHLLPALHFETYNLTLNAYHGPITSHETFLFTAHTLLVRVIHGNITGTWSLPSSVRFIVHTGTVDIDLVPKKWSYGPQTQGDLHAESADGSVHIRMPLERDQLSLRNGTTVIQSGYHGVISGSLVHGFSTTILSQGYGSINLTLLPYWAFPEWAGVQFNHLRTDNFGGLTELQVLEPVVDPYYGIQEGCLMRSFHKSIIGSMRLVYPRGWCGVATGVANDVLGPGGRVGVSGEDFEVVYERPDAVKVQRRPLGSELVFEVVGGEADLVLL